MHARTSLLVASLRHRNAGPRLRAVGPGAADTSERHVRIRRVRLDARHTPPGERSLRREAALLRLAAGPLRLRQRAHGRCASTRRSTRRSTSGRCRSSSRTAIFRHRRRLSKASASCTPAGWLEYDCATGTVETQPYWRFRLEPDESLDDRSEARLVDELRALLAAAVRRRLVSDVPLGIFLSGGLDSAAVLAFASQHVPPSELSTFTIGFSERTYDESQPGVSPGGLLRDAPSRGDLRSRAGACAYPGCNRPAR